MKQVKQQERPPLLITLLIGVLLLAILLLSSAMAVYQNLDLQLYNVSGTSMMPTVAKNSTVLVNPKKEKERFDIVVFKGGDAIFIKRLIGLPGDTIGVENGQLFINDKPISEPYVLDKNRQLFAGESFQIDVPTGCYFVLGDNRDDSIDSRETGVVAEDTLLGVVSLIKQP